MMHDCLESCWGKTWMLPIHRCDDAEVAIQFILPMVPVVFLMIAWGCTVWCSLLGMHVPGLVLGMAPMLVVFEVVVMVLMMGFLS